MVIKSILASHYFKLASPIRCNILLNSPMNHCSCNLHLILNFHQRNSLAMKGIRLPLRMLSFHSSKPITVLGCSKQIWPLPNNQLLMYTLKKSPMYPKRISYSWTQRLYSALAIVYRLKETICYIRIHILIILIALAKFGNMTQNWHKSFRGGYRLQF